MESDHCDRCGTFHKGWIPYDNSVDTLLIKLGFSCDIRAAFAEETISLECIADLEPGDFKEAGVKIGDRPMLKQAAAREFASMQGRAPTTTNQPVDPTDNEAATPASTPLSARGPAASIIRADPTEQPASKRPRVTTALPNRCASFEEAMLLAPQFQKKLSCMLMAVVHDAELNNVLSSVADPMMVRIRPSLIEGDFDIVTYCKACDLHFTVCEAHNGGIKKNLDHLSRASHHRFVSDCASPSCSGLSVKAPSIVEELSEFIVSNKCDYQWPPFGTKDRVLCKLCFTSKTQRTFDVTSTTVLDLRAHMLNRQHILKKQTKH